MKKSIVLLVLSLITLTLMGRTPAFPTAEGYGKWATGGRGGQVVEVTNLLDDPSNPPAGSFRWALKQYKGQPITIVFRVSGIIDLKGNDLRNNRSDITIAGQTAPGDGICIKGGCVNLGGSRNLIIRHIRSRVGVLDDNSYNPDVAPGKDQFIAGASLNIENGGNFIVDHCSFSWSAEENVGFYDNDNTTVQWCIFSEGLYDAGHGKGARSYGAVLGGKTATYHHNLLAHNYNRSPRFGATTKNDVVMLLDYVNNVNYNSGKKNSCYGGDNRQGDAGLFQLNYVNNYYKPGPAYPGDRQTVFIGASYCNPSQGDQGKSYGKWHLSGNYMEGSYAQSKGLNTNNYNGFDISAYTEAVPGLTLNDMKSDHIPVAEPVITETAAQAYQSVLKGVGAFPRDTVDRRIINEVRTGTASGHGTFDNHRVKGIINKPSDAGGYGEFRTYGQVTDNDHDGMDDAWELANGFDPTRPEDRNYILKSGYTALEAYLCSLVGENIPIEREQPYDLTVAKDGSGNFTTINAAIEAVPEDGKRHTIFVRNGIYEEKVFIGTHHTGSSKIISMIGEDVDKVIITWEDYHGCTISDYPGKGTISNAGGQYCATMTVNAKDFYMENITVQNPSTKAQAEALYQCGDRQILKNCKILGFQDTHRTKKGARYFYYDCTIEGHVDFIYAGGTCYFYRCNIVSVGKGYLTAPEDIPYYATLGSGKKLYYGFIFNDCDITAKNTSVKDVYLGRPWAKESGSIFMKCRLGSHIRTEGWSTMGGDDYQTTSMGEYKNLTADGTALADVSKRVSWSFQLTDNEYYNLMNLKTIYQAVNSKNTFDPLNEVVAVYPPANFKVSGKTLTWDTVANAKAYAIYANDTLIDYTATNRYCDTRALAKTVTYKVKSIAENGWMSPFNGTPYNLTYHLLDSLLNPDHRVTVATQVLPSATGSVKRTPDFPSYVLGSTVELSATPISGYRFSFWSNQAGDTLSTEAVYNHTVTKADTITANFITSPTYTLTLLLEGGKQSLVSVSPKPFVSGGKEVYEEGTAVTLTAASHHYHAFSHWDDGSTELERTIVIASDTTVTAFFTDSAYLLAWDFSTTGDKAYKANQKRESSLSGTLYLTNDNGKQFLWDDHSAPKGGWMGQPAVCNGNSVSDNTFFYINCSVEEYGKLRISFSYGAKNHVWSRYLLQYATDDGDYTDFGSITLTQSNLGKWTTAEFKLPSSCDYCEEVRIRWYPDLTSKFMGNKYGYEGFSLSEIYILSGDIQPEPPTAIESVTADKTLNHFQIYDLSGVLIVEGTGSIPESSLRTGIYLVRYHHTDGSTLTQKLKICR